jgi:uncharacterized protein YndB with AHSA1/START domain
MKRYERSIAIARPPEETFAFFADMGRMPEWASEDFVSVTRDGDGPIERGARFRYVTRGATARSHFEWVTFDPPRELRFTGPRVDVGPGWVEGLGGYKVEAAPDGTRVTAWFEPTLGGLLALMSPFARMRNVRLLSRQLARAKALIEA